MQIDFSNVEVIKAIIQGVATIVGALIVGFFGTVIQRRYGKQRDKQDKESQWRQHAIELTKLDLQRKLTTTDNTKKNDSLRPSILDFLANFRDLQELGDKSPKELYKEIMDKRIAHLNNSNDEQKSE